MVENELYRIVFTNRGAQAKSWVLKKYKDEKGQPLDLVNPASASFGLPLSLYAYDDALRNKVNTAFYVSSSNSHVGAPGEISFEYSDGSVSVRKTLRFDSTYVVWLETVVTVGGKPVQAYPAWPAGFGDQGTGPSFASARIDYFAGDKVERLAAKKISGGNTLRGPLQWAGSQDQYFAAIFLPDVPNQAAMVTFRNSIQVPKDPAKPDPNNLTKVEVLGAAVGDIDGATRERIFVGPKTLDVLATVHCNTLSGEPGGPDLSHAVDFGFFSLIARPLFLWLLWTHDHIAPNWGVSIIILTVIINLALLPLAHHQHEVGAEDAETAAPDEGHPGEIQEVSDARPQARRHEHRDLRAVQRARRKSSGRLFAARHSDALPVCVLLDARGCD